MTKDDLEWLAAFFLCVGLAFLAFGVLYEGLKDPLITWALIRNPSLTQTCHKFVPPIGAALIYVAISMGLLMYGAIFGRKHNGGNHNTAS